MSCYLLQDWWWKARLGKCYYQLGMLREAEKQLLSALKTADMLTTVLELSKVGLNCCSPCQQTHTAWMTGQTADLENTVLPAMIPALTSP